VDIVVDVPWGPHAGLLIKAVAPLDTPCGKTLKSTNDLRKAQEVQEDQTREQMPWEEAAKIAQHAEAACVVDDFPGAKVVRDLGLDGSQVDKASKAYAVWARTLETWYLGGAQLDTAQADKKFGRRAVKPMFANVRIGRPIVSDSTGPSWCATLWASTAVVIDRTAGWLKGEMRHARGGAEETAEVIKEMAEKIRNMWKGTTTPRFTGDHDDPHTDIGKAVGAIDSLSDNNRGWKECCAAVAAAVKDHKGGELKYRKLACLTEQTRCLRAKVARVGNLAHPARNEAETLAEQMGYVAKHMAEGCAAYDPLEVLHALERQVQKYREQATRWAAAVRDMEFLQWLRSALDKAKVGELHKWANADNVCRWAFQEEDPSKAAKDTTDKWGKAWKAGDQAEQESTMATLRGTRERCLMASAEDCPIMKLARDRTEPETLRKICHSFPTNTSIGSDGVRFKEIAEGPDEALDELGQLIRDAVRDLVPAVQALFHIIVGIPKKNPLDKRDIAILTTWQRLLQKVLAPAFQEWDVNHADVGDTAVKGSSLEKGGYERHMYAEAHSRTGSTVVGVLWDLQGFYASVNATVAERRALGKEMHPRLLGTAAWSHRAPRVVRVERHVGEILNVVPHSLVAGCTSSMSITRSMLPSVAELELRTGRHAESEGDSLYRHVDDHFQMGWAPSTKAAVMRTIALGKRLARWFERLKLQVSDKTTVVSNSAIAGRLVANALEGLGCQPKRRTKARTVGSDSRRETARREEGQWVAASRRPRAGPGEPLSCPGKTDGRALWQPRACTACRNTVRPKAGSTGPRWKP
jgi:hypothetical protein